MHPKQRQLDNRVQQLLHRKLLVFSQIYSNLISYFLFIYGLFIEFISNSLIGECKGVLFHLIVVGKLVFSQLNYLENRESKQCALLIAFGIVFLFKN